MAQAPKNSWFLSEDEFLKKVEPEKLNPLPEITAEELYNPPKPELENRGFLHSALPATNKALRTMTANSPLVGALATAALAGIAGYAGAPILDRVLSPAFGGKTRYYNKYHNYKKRRKRWGIALASLAGLGFLGTQISSKRPGYGLITYHPMKDDGTKDLEKTASMPGISIADSTRLIMENPNLTPQMKSDALALLHSFDRPSSAPVNGGSLVGQAINTGISAATGAAVGFVTANALGLPNPSSTAILGAIQNTLGTGAALGTSLIFGH